jgi:sulfite exporter TauE/SafE
MQTTLAVTGLLMGLAGGPHCVAMCGAACGGIGRVNKGAVGGSLWLFQAGRLAGYSVLGALSAASIQSLGWLTIHSAALRPVWSLFHAAAFMLGLMLLWRARQPIWLEGAGRAIWKRIQISQPGSSGPLWVGVLWALLPCGLLYSAVLVAGLSANAIEGAIVMALFALGSGVSLMAGPWLWLRLRNRGSDRWAVRLAGFALAATSGWALWMGLVHNTAPWCVTI